MKHFPIIAACSLLVFANTALAGGTLGTEELDPLFAQKPAVWAALKSGLKLSDSAFAEIRFGSHLPHLGGRRAGPYLVRAAALDGTQVEIVLCTHFRYLHSAGHPIPESRIEAAYDIDERLDDVVIREIEPGRISANCR